MLTKEQKQERVTILSDKFGRAKAAFLVDFKGMNVEQVTGLRKSLFSVQSEMQVVRNTLAIRALKNHPESEKAMENEFVGNNAVVFAFEDASATAKALSTYAKTVETLVLKSGLMDGKRLDEEGIKVLSTLPGKQELRAMFLGTLQAPMQQMVSVMSQVPAGFARVLQAKADKG